MVGGHQNIPFAVRFTRRAFTSYKINAMNFEIICFWISAAVIFYLICRLVADFVLNYIPKEVKELQKYSGEEQELKIIALRGAVVLILAFIVALTSFCAIFMYATYIKY